MTGKTYTISEVKDRVDKLARGLSKELGLQPNKGSEWDKVIAVFSVNTVDTIPLSWATHRLGGLQTPANAAYSASELAYQLKDSKAKALFTCLPLLDTARKAAKDAGIPDDRLYILDIPEQFTGGKAVPKGMKTLDDLILEGSKLEPLEPLKWEKGQGAKQAAFLCYSSGTSGLPVSSLRYLQALKSTNTWQKGVMISHRNVIANISKLPLEFENVTQHRLTISSSNQDL